MGKHKKDDNRDFSALSPAEKQAWLQGKANEFDAQHQRISDRSRQRREAGEGPWSADKAIEQAGQPGGADLRAGASAGGCLLLFMPWLLLFRKRG